MAILQDEDVDHVNSLSCPAGGYSQKNKPDIILVC